MDRKNGKSHVLSRHNTNGSNASTFHPPSQSPQPTKTTVKRHTGSLEILEGNASDVYRPDSGASQSSSRPPSQGVQRSWSRSSFGSVPPRPDSSASRRLTTPTKQISLQAVKRKEESSEPFVPDIDFQKLNLDKSYNRAWNLTSYLDEDEVQNTSNFNSSEADGYALQHATQLRLPQQRPDTELSTQNIKESQDEINSSSGASAGVLSTNHQPGPSGSGQSVEQRGEDALAASSQHRSQNSRANNENGSDDDSSEDEGERRAPNELLMEFVECLMKKDYKNADKLCKMILLYEPANPEALKFQPVIEEKLKLDAEAEAADEGEDNDEDEDDGDDGEEDEDDEDDDDSDSEDTDSDDGDDDESDDSEDEDNQSIFRIMAAAVASNYYESHDSEGNNQPSGSKQ